MSEIGERKYLERKLQKWKENKDAIIKNFGKNFYHSHFNRLQMKLRRIIMTWFVCMINNGEDPEAPYYLGNYREKWFTFEAESKEDAKKKVVTILESIRMPCCYGELTEEQRKINDVWGSFIRLLTLTGGFNKDDGCGICGIPKTIIETLRIYSLEELRLKA